jgi:diguanylate cyclase (GGDEF)-like protein
MKTFGAFLRAFRRLHTYNYRRNSYLWLGVFWGMLIPSFVYTFDLSLMAAGSKGPLEAFRAHPAHIVLLIQPVVLGFLFGAMGTVRRDLEIENHQLIESLQELAMTDSLTGLYNRRYIKEAIKNLQETARRTQKPVFVILIDLDGFKTVNDTRGHITGDQVLCDAAAALKSTLRQADILGRHGGDEFILIGLSDRASAKLLVDRAAQAVRSKTGLGLSAGIGCWPEDGPTADELIAAADRSLVSSKQKSHDSRTLPRITIPAEGM